MKTKNELAATLIRIQQHGDSMDEVAAPMLSQAKALGINTVDALNEWVYAAYDENNWSRKAGRPFADQVQTAAPDVVKLYVSNFRSALKHGFDLNSFETIGAMRAAVRNSSPKAVHALSAERLPELKGIQVANENKLTGALCHDIAIFVKRLPEEKRIEMEERILKVMRRYSRLVRAALLADEEKAANLAA